MHNSIGFYLMVGGGIWLTPFPGSCWVLEVGISITALTFAGLIAADALRRGSND